jgi:hypothetical protein
MANGKDDIRVAASWPHHPKRRKLKQLVGAEGVLALIDLWCFAGENRPDGVLKSAGEAEEVTSWSIRRKGSLHAALVECGWIEADGVTLHDWKQEQPWIVNRDRRVASARTNGKAGGLAKAKKHPSGPLAESYRTPSGVLPPSSPLLTRGEEEESGSGLGAPPATEVRTHDPILDRTPEEQRAHLAKVTADRAAHAAKIAAIRNGRKPS